MFMFLYQFFDYHLSFCPSKLSLLMEGLDRPYGEDPQRSPIDF